MLIQILDLLLEQGGQVAEEFKALGGASGFGPLREQIRQRRRAPLRRGSPRRAGEDVETCPGLLSPSYDARRDSIGAASPTRPRISSASGQPTICDVAARPYSNRVT